MLARPESSLVMAWRGQSKDQSAAVRLVPLPLESELFIPNRPHPSDDDYKFFNNPWWSFVKTATMFAVKLSFQILASWILVSPHLHFPDCRRPYESPEWSGR